MKARARAVLHKSGKALCDVLAAHSSGIFSAPGAVGARLEPLSTAARK
eukprot:CAMPEP_0119096460 /NCGR_PEP_ID=MMETSP1178-20130426/172977_1 /TAXON_ID=33656 /ORGANISM="unid sp, Strain CCMP2000" /LENGTH=47 /DNA_ID= /DNA_START= /DNA_END= /DNA_ORIENTATION=